MIPGTDTDPSWHSPILAHYKDFGISEEEWIAKREDCDINRDWSAGVAQRLDENGVPRPYYYLCEVMMTLDGVRGVNNGKLCTPGWWKQPIEHYADQVRNCCDQGCGVPLRGKARKDSDQVVEYSEHWEPLIQMSISAGNKKVKAEKLTSLQHNAKKVTDYVSKRK